MDRLPEGLADRLRRLPIWSVWLLGSIPRLDADRGEKLTAIPGSVGDNLPWASACAFAPRCPRELQRCREETPLWEEHPATGLRCHNPAEMSHD